MSSDDAVRALYFGALARILRETTSDGRFEKSASAWEVAGTAVLGATLFSAANLVASLIGAALSAPFSVARASGPATTVALRRITSPIISEKEILNAQLAKLYDDLASAADAQAAHLKERRLQLGRI